MGDGGFPMFLNNPPALSETAANRRRNAFFTEHWPAVLESLRMYAQEPGTTCLNLPDAKLKTKEIKSILEAVKESQISELDLTGNNFRSGVKSSRRLLAATPLRKLNVSKCDLTEVDVLHLMEMLRDTEITDLDFSENDVELSDESLVHYFVPFLLDSGLTVLNMSRCYFMGGIGALSFVQALPNTSITRLNLTECELQADSLACLFSNLPATSITDLTLSLNRITPNKLQPICRSLRHSRLEKLDLSENDLGDEGADLLFASLPGSRIKSLNLDNNYIDGANNLGRYLLSTEIEHLSLYYNPIRQDTMFSFPDFVFGSSVTTLNFRFCQLGNDLAQLLMNSLQGSAVTKLDISGNNLQPASIAHFTNIVRHTVLEDINFSDNRLSPEAILMLGDSLRDSGIKRIDISQNFHEPSGSAALSEFIARTRGSLVESLSLSQNHIDARGAEMIAANLPGTTFTHLNLTSNRIGAGAVHLATQLKFTAITHLDLTLNDIGDEGAVALAACLKESSLLSLNLEENGIMTGGLAVLAAQAENTFFYHFEGGFNGEKLLLYSILWNNRVFARQLVSFFKLIAPVINSENFCFDVNLNAVNVHEFIENCARLYKIVIEQPASISVLAEEDSLPFSRQQISTLLLERFPGQFIDFINRRIKANVNEFVKVLKKVDELGLMAMLMPLLAEPPVLQIDANLRVTHPFFYTMSSKYGQPSQFERIEPQNTLRVVRYLSENPALEGLDMIRILCNDVPN